MCFQIVFLFSAFRNIGTVLRTYTEAGIIKIPAPIQEMSRELYLKLNTGRTSLPARSFNTPAAAL